MEPEFSADFRKNTQILNFMQIRPLGAELSACGRVDMTKPIVASRNFANASKKVHNFHQKVTWRRAAVRPQQQWRRPPLMRLSHQHALPSNRLPAAFFESRNSHDKRQMVLSLQCKWLYCAHKRHATSSVTRAVIKQTKTWERNRTKINLRQDENINHILTFCNTSQEGETPFKLLFACAIAILYPLLREPRRTYGSYKENTERN